MVDFYRPLRPDRNETHYLNVARGMTIFWALTRLGVALAAIPLLADRSVIRSPYSDGLLSFRATLAMNRSAKENRPVKVSEIG